MFLCRKRLFDKFFQSSEDRPSPPSAEEASSFQANLRRRSASTKIVQYASLLRQSKIIFLCKPDKDPRGSLYSFSEAILMPKNQIPPFHLLAHMLQLTWK